MLFLFTFIKGLFKLIDNFIDILINTLIKRKNYFLAMGLCVLSVATIAQEKAEKSKNVEKRMLNENG